MLYEVDNFVKSNIDYCVENGNKMSDIIIKIGIARAEGNRIMVTMECNDNDLDYDLFGDEYIPFDEAKEEAFKVFCYLNNTYKCNTLCYNS